MNTNTLKQLVFDTLDELKAIDITMLDVSNMTSMTDWMVICSGRSQRHVKGLAENLTKVAKQHGVQPLSVEGLQASEWVLVDLADVVVHIMQPKIRDFYQLEQLWTATENEKTHQA